MSWRTTTGLTILPTKDISKDISAWDLPTAWVMAIFKATAKAIVEVTRTTMNVAVTAILAILMVTVMKPTVTVTVLVTGIVANPVPPTSRNNEGQVKIIAARENTRRLISLRPRMIESGPTNS